MDVEVKRRRLAEVNGQIWDTPYPRTSKQEHEFSEELGAIWFELVTYDPYIVGIIQTILLKKPVRFELYYEQELQDRLDAIVTSGSEAAVEDAQHFLDYFALPKEAVELGLEILAES